MCLGGIGAALFWHFYPGFWKDPLAAAPTAAAMQGRAALLPQVQVPRATAATDVLVPSPTACGFEPLIPPGSAADGQVRMEHPFPAGPRAKAKVFLRIAKNAAANGRPRDEEVALIAACRYSDEASTAPTVPLARVLGQLGDRYLAAAAGETSFMLQEELRARAREVLALSADTYAKALGPNASRSREARRRVETLEEGMIVAADPPGPHALARITAEARPAARKAASVAPRRTAAPAAPERSAAVRVRPAAPDAAAVREETPTPSGPMQPREASDAELRQLASDLARLRAQAEAVGDDPAGLRRRAELAQAQRAQCPDKACLLDWYARRRRELLAEF